VFFAAFVIFVVKRACAAGKNAIKAIFSHYPRRQAVTFTEGRAVKGFAGGNEHE
jgi:hypothetical protein